MIKKHTTLSFAFCALMLSSTLVSVIPCAAQTNFQEVEAKTQEITELNLDTANPECATGKTTKQRIISGLGHTALFLPSAFMATAALWDSNNASKEPFFYSSLLATCLFGTYAGATGIYSAIKNKPEIPESSVSKIDVAKNTVLGAAALVVFHDFCTANDKTIFWIVPAVPMLYAFHKSGKTLYKAIQQHKNSADLQKPEILTITE
jgi:hypothetical protein